MKLRHVKTPEDLPKWTPKPWWTLRGDNGWVRDGWLIGGGITLFVAILGGLITALIVITTNANYHFAVQGCKHWSEANNRPAHEVRYTWGTWDCITPNPAVPGTWIPTSKLWVVNR